MPSREGEGGTPRRAEERPPTELEYRSRPHPPPRFDMLQCILFPVDQAVRELGTRFDFRGVDAKIELEEESILLTAPEEFQIGQLKDI